MPSGMARSLLTLMYQMLPVLCWDRSWLLLMQTSFIQTHLKMHTQACKGTQMHLFLHLSYRKWTAPTHSSFRNKFGCYWLKSTLPRTHFPSLPLTDCPTLHLSPCLHNSPPSSSLRLFYCCHLLFALHGFWLQPRGNFASSTEFTYKHIHACTWGEKKKYMPSEDLFIKCAVKSCQAFHIRAHFSSPRLPERKGSNKSAPQCNFYNVTFTTLYYSSSINSVLWTCVHRDHFIGIVNSCYWCWCQGLTRRQVIKHRPRNVLMLQKNASL